MPNDDVLTGEVQGNGASGASRLAPPAVQPMVFKSDPWEQQPNETAEAYLQFAGYRDMDPEERTIRAAWQVWRGRRAERGEELAELPSGGFQSNYAKWRWEERARAYDVDLERRARKKLERRKLNAMAEIADVGETMRKKGAAAIRMMTAVEQRIRNENGQEVIILETKMTPTEAVKMVETGAKLEMLALGEPTERMAMGEDPNAPFGMVEADAAKEELRKRIENMRKRREIAVTASREVAEEERAGRE